MAKQEAPSPTAYRCVRVAVRKIDGNSYYRYSFEPVLPSQATSFSSAPLGELSFMNAQPSLFSVGQTYELFPTGE